jgi:hypothetical protein
LCLNIGPSFLHDLEHISGLSVKKPLWSAKAFAFAKELIWSAKALLLQKSESAV